MQYLEEVLPWKQDALCKTPQEMQSAIQKMIEKTRNDHLLEQCKKQGITKQEMAQQFIDGGFPVPAILICP